MGHARNQRRSAEGTFLEHVRDQLRELNADLDTIKQAVNVPKQNSAMRWPHCTGDGRGCLPCPEDQGCWYDDFDWSGAWYVDSGYFDQSLGSLPESFKSPLHPWNVLVGEFTPLVQAIKFSPEILAKSTSMIDTSSVIDVDVMLWFLAAGDEAAGSKQEIIDAKPQDAEPVYSRHFLLAYAHKRDGAAKPPETCNRQCGE